jgi:hypothetical protein
MIGTIGHECLYHMIVFSERCLYRHPRGFTEYYHRSRTHLRLEKDSPEPRSIRHRTRDHRDSGDGGLRRRYERHPAEQLAVFRVSESTAQG